MSTVSTEYIEPPPATATRPGRLRRHVAHNVLLVLVFLGCGGFGVFSLLNGDYLRGSLDTSFALLAGVQLAFLIAGRDFAKDFGNRLVRHPWLGVLFYSVLFISMFVWLLNFKNANDRRRAAAFQARVQATQLVKGTQ